MTIQDALAILVAFCTICLIGGILILFFALK